jgi:hypothetical protein
MWPCEPSLSKVIQMSLMRENARDSVTAQLWFAAA